jgi:Tfp pilus assembly protein PilE
LHNRRPPASLKQHGFTYTEVMLSAVLLAVLLVPALEALQTGIAGGATQSVAARSPLLSAKMEEVLAKPFTELYAESYKTACDSTCNPAGSSACNSATLLNCNLSDAANAANATDRRVVVLYRYDADPSTRGLSVGDTGLLYIRVYFAAEGSANALNTLAGRWW